MTEIDIKDPKFLAFWTECIASRPTGRRRHWPKHQGSMCAPSREWKPAIRLRITTRRALARGLGYDNPDVFDDPEFIKAVLTMLDGIRQVEGQEAQKQFPGHIRLSVTRVTSGEGLARVAFEASAYLFHADEEIVDEAKDLAASIFDFLRDLGDLGDDGSFSERLGYQRSLGELLEQLEELSAACYSAFRPTKMTGANWVGQFPGPADGWLPDSGTRRESADRDDGTAPAIMILARLDRKFPLIPKNPEISPTTYRPPSSFPPHSIHTPPTPCNNPAALKGEAAMDWTFAIERTPRGAQARARDARRHGRLSSPLAGEDGSLGEAKPRRSPTW